MKTLLIIISVLFIRTGGTCQLVDTTLLDMKIGLENDLVKSFETGNYMHITQYLQDEMVLIVVCSDSASSHTITKTETTNLLSIMLYGVDGMVNIYQENTNYLMVVKSSDDNALIQILFNVSSSWLVWRIVIVSTYW